MKTVIITGSAGLIGSESVKYFCEKGFQVVGIDNDLRKYFFGPEASTNWTLNELSSKYKNFTNESVDIRDFDKVSQIFKKYSSDITLVILMER
jgi:CDP-paratose 2-epimerase